MASSRSGKGKKAVSQEELRRLMKEKQKESTDKKKRVESPFAKYNSLGHLSCVLCNVPVKSEILWQAHIFGKQHKEKVAELKGTKQSEVSGPDSQSAAVVAVKRKSSDPEHPEAKKGKRNNASSVSGLPADLFEGRGEQKPTTSKQSSGLGILAGNYDVDDDNDNDGSGGDKNGQSTPGTGSSTEQNTTPGLPADFFDSSLPSAPAISHSGSVLKPDEPEKPIERKDNTAEALPEGFFDDPVKDAKVRKVDTPKDQMDKEWEEFQKEMRHVNSASEAIVAEEDEDGRLERQIDEIDEQIECFRRVEHLRDKREVVKTMLQEQVRSRAREKQRGSAEQEEEDLEEEQLLSLLSRDWRAKGVLS